MLKQIEIVESQSLVELVALIDSYIEHIQDIRKKLKLNKLEIIEFARYVSGNKMLFIITANILAKQGDKLPVQIFQGQIDRLEIEEKSVRREALINP